MASRFEELNHLQIGRYGEYLVKMEVTKLGFDVYTAEIDDKGIDFVVRVDGKTPKYFDAQVKTISKSKLSYVFMKKSKFPLRNNNYLFLVMLGEDACPEIFIIPSIVWKKPNELFISRDFEGEDKKSPPEWGILLAKKRLGMLQKYRLGSHSKL